MPRRSRALLPLSVSPRPNAGHRTSSEDIGAHRMRHVMSAASPHLTTAGRRGPAGRPGRPGPGTPARLLCAFPAACLGVTLLAACGGGGPGAQPGPAATVTVTPGAQAVPSASPPVAPAAVVPPGMIAVTTGGALVVLSPVTGAVARTLVPGGATGDEISVCPDGATVYFAAGKPCASRIESVP